MRSTQPLARAVGPLPVGRVAAGSTAARALRTQDRAAPEPRPRFDDPAAAFAGRSTADLARAQWMFRALSLPPQLTNLAMRGAQAGLYAGVPGVEPLIKSTVFSLFCGGTNRAELGQTLAQLESRGVRGILDYAVEGEQSEAGFDAARDELIRTVEFAAEHPAASFCALKMTALAPTGALARAQSGKLEPGDAEALARGRERLEAIVRRAHDKAVPLLIDAEESWIQGTIDAAAEAMMARYNRERPLVYTTLQMYRRDRPEYLERLLADAKDRGYIAGIKLVRGAYLEKETREARTEQRDSPLHADKGATDAAYDRGIARCLDSLDHVALCAATHNRASVEKLLDGMDARGLTAADPRISVAQLYGMADRLTFPLAKAGYSSAKYLPFGPVRDVFPYLVRRAEENNAVGQQASGERAMIAAELARRAHTSAEV